MDFNDLSRHRVESFLERISAALAPGRQVADDRRVAQAHELLRLQKEAVDFERELINAPTDWHPAVLKVSRAIGALSSRIRGLTVPPGE